MGKTIRYFFIFSLLVLLFQNCGDMDGKSDSSSSQSLSQKANFTWINENIIQPKCVECHNGSFAFGGLKMTTYQGVMESVQPGDPMGSSFYVRSFRTEFFELTDEERSIIRAWIAEGALED